MEKKILDIVPLLQSENVSKSILEAYKKLTPYDNLDDFVILKNGARVYWDEYEFLLLEDKSVATSRKIEMNIFNKSMKMYSDGFKHGYFNFDKEIVEDKASVFNDEKGIKLSIVFNFVNNNVLNPPDSVTIIGHDRDKALKEIYKLGLQRGYLYKGWKIILEHQDLFEPMFKEPVKPSPKKKEVTPFADCLKHDRPDQLAQMLKDSFTEMKRPKQVAIFIHELNKLDLLKTGTIKRSELRKSIIDYFETNDFNSNALNKYLNYKFNSIDVERELKQSDTKEAARRIVLSKNRLL